MARLLVTIGTDGFTDWVRLPNGERLNLGPVSALSFVSKLAKGRYAKAILDGFLLNGEALVTVDEAAMWALLTPARARWASDLTGPFMTSDPSRNTMAKIDDRHLSKLETHVAALTKFASKATPKKMEEGRAILMRLAQAVRVAEDQEQQQEEQQKQAAEQAQEEQAQEEQQKQAAEQQDQEESQDKQASLHYDTFKASNDLATTILAKAEDTIAKIDRLASAGKKFNAARAKADVHAVTSKVAGILRDTDLTKAWVREDLQKLAAQADKLHRLFPSKA